MRPQKQQTMTKNFTSTICLLTIFSGMFLSSCCTVFTSSKQTITFMAPDGTKIYDAATNVKIAEVKQDNMATARLKKRREDKQFIARKEGFQNTPFMLETSFNAASLWNILFWPGFLVDLGTSKMFKWENPIVNIELEPEAQPKND